jgi:hypothetical protein
MGSPALLLQQRLTPILKALNSEPFTSSDGVILQAMTAVGDHRL